MTRWIVTLSACTLGVLVVGGALAPVASADVRIGVNVGVPGVVVAPPVVVAPGVPVYYYGTSYYTHYNGAWFIGPGYGGPWHFVPVGRVPRPIFAVPHAYLRVPHGHAKHIAGPPPWGHGPRHWHNGHGRDHGHGHGKHKHKHGRH
jgi:hypothetical protein